MGTAALVSLLTGAVSSIPSREQIANEMDKILSSPEFSSKDTLWEMIRNWLMKLLSKISINGDTANLSAIIILVITVLLLVLVVVFAVLRISRLLGKQSRHTMGLYDISPEFLTPEKSLEAASKEAEHGNYSAAIRWLFISILLMLDKQSYLKISESKTNRQYLRELKKNSYPYINSLENLIYRFNRIRFGGKQAVLEDYLYWMDAVKSISSLDFSPAEKEAKGGDGYFKK